MTVFEMAKQYFPRLWDRSRIETLVKAGKLTLEEAEEIIGEPIIVSELATID